MKTTTLAILLGAIVGSAEAAPYGTNVPLAAVTASDYQSNNHYTIEYDSFFGGHWMLKGTRQKNKDGSYTDTFQGSVSNTSINGTYTQSKFTWLSDSGYACNLHRWIACNSFTLTIGAGNVKGTATYRP